MNMTKEIDKACAAGVDRGATLTTGGKPADFKVLGIMPGMRGQSLFVTATFKSVDGTVHTATGEARLKYEDFTYPKRVLTAYTNAGVAAGQAAKKRHLELIGAQKGEQ